MIKARTIREKYELTASFQWLMEQDMFTVQVISSGPSAKQPTKIQIKVSSKSQGSTTLEIVKMFVTTDPKLQLIFYSEDNLQMIHKNK